MKLTREQNKSGYLMGATNVKEVSKCGVEIVTFEKNGMLLSLHWWGKAAKPAKHYRWTTAEKMEAFVEKTLLQAELLDANKKVVAARKKAAREAGHPYKVGDVLYGSWGYDQTNIDYFQITGATKKSVTLKQICGDVEEYTSWASANVSAVKDSFLEGGKEYKKIPQCYLGSDDSPQWYINSPIYGTLYPWDGKPKYKSWYA